MPHTTTRAASENLVAPSSGVFSNIENAIVATFGAGGPGGDWEEVEGCWVLFPAQPTEPVALVHFIGGAFVGAAPQLSYKLFLESLAARGVVVCGGILFHGAVWSVVKDCQHNTDCNHSVCNII